MATRHFEIALVAFVWLTLYSPESAVVDELQKVIEGSFFKCSVGHC